MWRGLLLIQSGKTLDDGKFGQLRNAFQVKLFHDPAGMMLHGSFTEGQVVGYSNRRSHGFDEKIIADLEEGACRSIGKS